jgi:hypothetical protein
MSSGGAESNSHFTERVPGKAILSLQSAYRRKQFFTLHSAYRGKQFFTLQSAYRGKQFLPSESNSHLAQRIPDVRFVHFASYALQQDVTLVDHIHSAARF